jgi:Ran-binding protein 1
VVQLDEVEVKSGEEDEDVLLDVKCKLYRFVQEANEWKERGVGQSRVLQHKDNKRCRYLMREEKTLKIRSNHLIMPGTQIQEHGGNDKALVFNCVDYADEEMKPELFCVRFASAERAQEFKRAYEDGGKTNEPLLKPKGDEKDGEGNKDGGGEGAADEVAEGLAKAKLDES